MGGFIHLSKTTIEQNRAILKKRKGTFQLMDEFHAKSLDGELNFPSNPEVTLAIRERMEKKARQVKWKRISLALVGLILNITIILLTLFVQVSEIL